MLPAARILFIFGIILILVAGVLYFGARFNFPIGRLPGDIRIERENFSCYIPLVTSILLSILVTIILNLLARLLNR